MKTVTYTELCRVHRLKIKKPAGQRDDGRMTFHEAAELVRATWADNHRFSRKRASCKYCGETIIFRRVYPEDITIPIGSDGKKHECEGAKMDHGNMQKLNFKRGKVYHGTVEMWENVCDDDSLPTMHSVEIKLTTDEGEWDAKFEHIESVKQLFESFTGQGLACGVFDPEEVAGWIEDAEKA